MIEHTDPGWSACPLGMLAMALGHVLGLRAVPALVR